MKTFFFIVGLATIIGLALFFKHRNGTKSKHTDFSENVIHTRWDSILVGRWEIYDTAVNPNEVWKTSADIEFFGNHKYRYNGTERYYGANPQYPTYHPEYLVVGGGSTGTWHASYDSSFILYGDNCDFRISEGESGYKKKVKNLTCENGFELKYGLISEVNFRSEIKVINKDSIMITGKSYSDDCQTYTLFTRNQ